ncbi:hypothetical protein V8F20_011946 [Naviculisporaceae sp. PSN 640]
MAVTTDIVVEPVNSADDFPQIYHCISEAFGRQIKDTIWMAMNPQWDTPEGQQKGALGLLKRWKSGITTNKDGLPNTVILKATLRDPQDGFRPKIVGAAIWSQASFVSGYGDPPTNNPAAAIEEQIKCPTERRFAAQMYASLWSRRVEVAREKADRYYSMVESDTEEPRRRTSLAPPAIFTLDTCAVDPAFQRRGVAGKLVAWGLEEAQRRGGLECTTEASPMGRVVYKRMGFRAEKGAEKDLVYQVDEEFEARDKPEIVFMRTWA